VLSCSQNISPGDDAATLLLWGVSAAWIDAVSLAFQEAAAQGITVLVTSGDQGSDSMLGSVAGTTEWNVPGGGDGKAHVQYPASDPWVLSCGGTTIGKNSSGTTVEYVYNDINSVFKFPNGTIGGPFATGGGVSDYFTQAKGQVPPWQAGAGVPASVNDGHVGRGVPDVAGNASSNSGYQIVLNGNPWFTGGTSAVAPLYAGLVAILNATLNKNIGFLNPMLYALGISGNNVCNDIIANPGATGNSLNGVPGYSVNSGWDACTGWGSIDGAKLLAALQAEYQKSLTIILQRSTFSQDEVSEVGGTFAQALFVTVAGLTPSDFPGLNANTIVSPSSAQLGQWAPKFAPLTGPGGAATNIQITPTSVASDDPLVGPHVQLFTFTYQLAFTDQGQAAFGLAGAYPQYLALEATLAPLAAFQQIELIKAADPFFSSEANGGTTIESEDLRVFYAWEGGPLSTVFGAPMLGNTPLDARSFIRWIIANLSGPLGQAAGSSDTFENTLTPQVSTLSLNTSTTGPNSKNIFNFAIARVRLTFSSTAVAAKQVRVFFRLWQAMSTDLVYGTPAGSGASPATGPFRQWSDGTHNGIKVPLLGISPDGTEYITVPFFATGRVGTSASMTTQPADWPNVQTINPPAGGGTAYAYFGCWLDTNQSAQSDQIFPPNPRVQGGPDGGFSGTLQTIATMLVRGGHQCLLAEIVFDDAPIEDGATPSTSDKLAQRNLAILPVS
jgi:hypothetical protein